MGWKSIALLGYFSLSAALPVAAQVSNAGNLTVNVLDPAGAVVPNAMLQLKDLGTNAIREGETQSGGTYLFPDLPFGSYELTISKPGFEKQVFQNIQVQTGRVTSINATLKIGGTTETVSVVGAAAPLVEPDSTVLANTIDTKQVVNLPVTGRNVMSFAFLVPGWSSTSGVGNTNGTWDNLPGGAVVSADFDGTPGISNRFRSGGFNYGTTAVQPRIEDVAEMTIQTAQLDLGGIGTSAMRISIVTRRGTNQWHGRLFEDFRNTDLNANSWYNNATHLPRSILKLNEFGGNVGGPILKNKLFVSGTWSQSIQPLSNNVSATVLSPQAQQGIFQYIDSSGATRSVNLLQAAGAAGLPATLNPSVADSFGKINGVLGKGSLAATSDPNIKTLNFLAPARINGYYPTIRGDLNLSDRQRIYLSYAQTLLNSDHVNTPLFPGSIPSDQALDYTSNKANNRIVGFGWDSVIRPTLINEFHAGYMYQLRIFDIETLGIDLPNLYRQNWPYGLTSLYGNAYPRRPISSFYPLLNALDNLTWQKGAHAFTLGASWYREQDHYWNGPGGEPNYTFGLDPLDPATNVINAALADTNTTNQTNARALYGLLAARVTRVSIGVGRPLNPASSQYKPFGAYNLDEVQSASGYWAQDRWHIRRNLTLNYGLRMDVVGDDHDVNGGYSTLRTLGDLYGPTPVGAVDQPGNLAGVANPQFQAGVHVYHTKVNFSPGVAIAWSPEAGGGIFEKLVGHNKTVIRTGYSLRHYTEGAQNFWAFASNSGQFFFQQGSATPGTANGVGSFVAGSLSFGDPLPQYQLTPTAYSKIVPAANLALSGNSFWGMNPNIVQPYVEQWNFGIERQIGSASALEIRYTGNLALHQWLGYNLNEVNIYENGFLQEFTNAQGNLRINQANGKGNTFAFNGLPGQAPLPIFTAAFGSATSNFSNSAFITNLQTGAAGALAGTLSGTPAFFCNMVGSAAFPACLTNRGINVPGAGYPINFWQANPFAEGTTPNGQVNYLDASGSSNYHALQVDFRQRVTHGMQFDVNYTWAHSLGIAAQNGIQGQGNQIYYTQRNFRLNYGPSLFDVRHVVHASGTYDLPFGKGRSYFNSSKLADYTIGGWTLGTIVSIQSGNPALLGGGYMTVNGNDSGINLNGITTSQLQSMVGVHHTGNPWVNLFDPKLIGANGAANPAYLTPASTAGVLGYRPYVWGPGWYNIDLSINKSIPIRESIRFTLQTEFLNLTNHPTFSFVPNNITANNLGILGTSFGQTTNGVTPTANGNYFSSARQIEFRANLEF
jgi:hypothetical protein